MPTEKSSITNAFSHTHFGKTLSHKQTGTRQHASQLLLLESQ